MGGLVELPSGGVDPGEGIIEALKREVLEETGLTITKVESILKTFDYTSGSGRKTRQLNFLVSVNDDKVKLNPDEHVEHYWVKPDSEDWRSLNVDKVVGGVVRSAFQLD